MKKAIFLLTAFLAVTAMAQSHREVTLSDGWQFSRDMANWQPVTVPHDWAISGPFDKKWDLQVVAIKENGEDVATEKSGRSGALPWIGKGYYRTSFTVPQGYKRAQLVFDGAMASPLVYVNGHEAGHWAYGYNAFIVDVTPLMHTGDVPNDLAVYLENLEESNRWYPGGGIYRPVKLVMTREKDAALDTWGLYVRTLGIDGEKATLQVEHQLDDATVLDDDFVLDITLTDARGQVVTTSKSAPDGMGHFATRFDVYVPSLWSPEDPYLYTVTATLMHKGVEVDRQSQKVGIRTVSFSQEGGFQLNGERRKIKGVCLHHDLGPLGAAVNKAALIRQIKMMKEMGADAIRTSHNMPSTMQMEVCDSLGMMVMAESFDGWKEPKVRNGYGQYWDEWWQQDIRNLVLNHRNHPSIIMWSVGNEIPEQWKPEGAQRYKNLIALCHELDPSRMVTCGMDQPDGTIWCGFAQVADVPGYNYRVHRYEEMIKRLPQGFLLGSETASTVSTRGHYCFPDTCATNKAWPDGQCSGYDVEYCWWSNLPDDDWKMQDDFDWTVGEFVWTGYDYLGEPTPYDEYWPSRSSYFGICDLAGLPKDRYYLYRSHWNKTDHTIHLLPHWTWPDRVGKVTPVYCYTDYPSAELFVNGKSLGRITKSDTARLDRYRLRWRDVIYQPGELKVVVYDEQGNKAGQQIVRTAGKPKRLLLEPERKTIAADGNDLAYITVSLVDKNGTLCPDAANRLQFTVTGAGTYKAACNGDATSLEPFTQPQMSLFHGQLVVVCQAGKKPGVMTLTVKDPATGLKSSVNITVK
jgi:beta-galactosidase